MSSQPIIKHTCWLVEFKNKAPVTANTIQCKQFYVGSYSSRDVKNPIEKARKPNIELLIALMNDLT